MVRNKFVALSCVSFAVAVVGSSSLADTYYMKGADVVNKTSFSSSSNPGGGIGWGTESGSAQSHTVAKGNDYIVPQGTALRSPTSGTPQFAGDTLSLSGQFNLKKAGDITVANLIGKGGSIGMANDKTLTNLKGGITVSADDTLCFLYGTSASDKADYRNLSVEATISGAGALQLSGSGVARQTYLYLNGDMSGFTGTISAAATEPPCFELRINNTYGGTVTSLPSTLTGFRYKYEGVNASGIRYTTTSYPAALKTALVVYSETADFTANSLPLVIFPLGTHVDPAAFTVKYATSASASATKFSSLGVKTTADGVVLLANPVSEGEPVDPPSLVTPLPYWTGVERTGVVERAGYTLSGHVATKAGNYTATATLKAGCRWSDNVLDASRTIDWTLYEFPRVESKSAFLLDLQDRPGRVHSSPYAAGGDMIFTNGDDFIHVFYKTDAATFVPAQAMMARVLAVAGGGAGGLVGGGGGAGGMLDLPSVAFAADASYTVTVGAGGIWPASYTNQWTNNRIVRSYQDDSGTARTGSWATANGKRFSGSDTTIVDADEKDIVRALGGGGGGSCGNKAGCNGGSGGGAYIGNTAGLGTEGQGHNGGRNAGSISSAGGGGAGAASADCNTNKQASDGGAGAPSDILGFEQYFAGGGSGGTEPSYGAGGAAGIGGGGRGATGYSSNNAKPGTDGLGGGGGGSGGQSGNVWAHVPGNGGTGLLVIRYKDPSKATTVPQIALTDVTTNANATATVGWTLMGKGDIDVIAVYGDAADHLCYEKTLKTAQAGNDSAALAGLLPGRIYYLALKARNAKDEESELTAVTSFTMPRDGAVPANPPSEQPVMGAPVIKDQTGGDFVLLDLTLTQAGTDATFAGCTATVRWSTQNSYAQMTASTSLAVNADGTVTLRPTGLTTSKYYACIEIVNANGYVDRLFIEFCSSDASTYRWNPAVAEGGWRDPANWTSETAKPWGLGYPLNDATADFTSTLCATVHVSGVIKVKAYGKEIKDGEYVFVGDTDDAEIYASSQWNGKSALQGGQTLVFDNINARVVGGFASAYGMSANDTFVLKNGANVWVCRNGDAGTIINFQKSGANSRVVISDGSALNTYNYGASYLDTGDVVLSNRAKINQTSASFVSFGRGVSVFVDDADIYGRGLIDFASATKSDETRVTLSGAAPTVISSAGSVCAQYTNAVVRLMLPVEGWTVNAPFRATASTWAFGTGYSAAGKLVSTKSIVFTVPKTAPIRSSTLKSAKESKVVAWPAGIDVAHVAFGKVARGGDYFYYTDANDAKYVYCTTNVTKLAAIDAPDEALETQPVVTALKYHHEPLRGLAVVVR